MLIGIDLCMYKLADVRQMMGAESMGVHFCRVELQKKKFFDKILLIFFGIFLHNPCT